MADAAEPTVQQLFKRWRSGDAEAGRAMAQKFTDWYYAITAVRLGDTGGRAPLQRACGGFAEGIVSVARSADLVDWAHDLVKREVEAAGGRIAGGDFPNALTTNRSPVSLLQQSRHSLSREQAELLHATYGGQAPVAELIELAERHAGWPHAVLESRYALKRWLRDHARINFSVVPDQPDLDRAPLPLYEAGRMNGPHEEDAFEKWLISDIDLCRDVAEFATFAHALRAGAFAGPHPEPASRPAAAPPAAPVAPPATAGGRPAADEPPPTLDRFDDDSSRAPGAVMGLAVAGVLGTLALIVVVLYFFLSP